MRIDAIPGPRRKRSRRHSGPAFEKLEGRSIPEPNSGCTLWMGAIDSDGYGRVWEPSISRMIAAHRVAYEQKFGLIPPGMAACHKCDVRACINPDHIFLGTHGDNMRDMVAKGRARGRLTGTAKVKVTP